MTPVRAASSFVALAVSLTILSAAPALAAPPGEVSGVAFAAGSTLSWSPASGADDYNVYRGQLSLLAADVPPRCHGDEIAGTSFVSPADPDPGEAFFYLVTGESDLDGEGPPGDDSGGAPRDLLGACDTVMRNHVLDRVGFGWDEWTRDRIAALGPAGFINEQLDPDSIDEASNTTLNNRLLGLEPPETIGELIGIQNVRAVYGRRQLERQVALFWENHFNTDYVPVYQFFAVYNPDLDRRRLEATTLQYNEIEEFRDLAFNASFRDLAGASALSPAMQIYLDNDNNVAGEPNENLAREVLELHTMGVDNGYTQTDVEEMARILTGWNVCKKETANVDDVLAACVPRIVIGTPAEPAGAWVINFRTNLHDCEAKTLFAGTAYETIVPDTCDGGGNPTTAGLNDIELALDAIVAHPSTPEFISTKLLRKFVSDTPAQPMIDAVVAEWNDGTHPAGIGDMREVLRQVLQLPEVLDPDRIGSKIKDPFEQVASGFRAARGLTNGVRTVINYLERMQHLYFANPIPTGYPEVGDDWLDTNNLLERQNFGTQFTRLTDNDFGSDLIQLLADNGVSTAPGNSAAIVDFFGDALFGGALTPAERQTAIDFLDTDDNGNPAPYDDARIRETVGLMLGYPQFAEQ